jgi:hypothetical protein
MEQYRGRAALEPSSTRLHGGSRHSQLHSTATTLLEVEQVTATVRARLGPRRFELAGAALAGWDGEFAMAFEKFDCLER